MNSRQLLTVGGVIGIIINVARFILFHNESPVAAIAQGVVVLGLLGFVVTGIKKWRMTPPITGLALHLRAACVGIAATLLAVLVATAREGGYGWFLFVFIPLATGFVAAYHAKPAQQLGISDAILAALLALCLYGIILISIAVEGLICLVMSIPLSVPLAILGGLIGRAARRAATSPNPAMFLFLSGILPFGPTAEQAIGLKPTMFAVTTSVDLPESREQVWGTILNPTKLDPPTHFLLRHGIAYPLASHIEGAGPAATRYCDFSTGKLVEPVLIWDDLHQLRFTVVKNPIPMQEWTFYAQLHPRHLDGFLVSRQGEFRLESLPNGRTRLHATTWYQHHLYPEQYWRLWSDYIIHQVHHMVLADIAKRAKLNVSGIARVGASTER